MGKKKPLLVCCAAVVAVIVILAAVLVALYFTLFRPRTPRVVATVAGAETSAFAVVPPALNLTFHVQVTVHNPNRAAFRFGDVATAVRYHGADVGRSMVPAGEIGARDTYTVVAAVEVDAVKVVFTPYFLTEALAGVLPFQTDTTVAGKAVVLGTFKISASAEVVCDASVYPLRNNATTECRTTVRIRRLVE